MFKNNTKTRVPSGLKKNKESEIRAMNIDQLIFDDRNTNIGTELGAKLLESSIQKYGAGRGVLVDKNYKIIAGNHAVKEMKRQGITNVIVVETSGDTLVVTQRTDIEKDSKVGHELALSDNRTTQANLSFDYNLIADLDADFNLSLEDLAINISMIGHDSGIEETDAADQMETSHLRDNTKYSTSDEPKQGQYEQSFFPLSIALSKAERLTFDAWKKEKKVQTDTEAFQLMFTLVKKK